MRERAVGKPADVCTFGLLLWELVTGRRAFGDEHLSDMCLNERIRNGRWVPNMDGRSRSDNVMIDQDS
jgi:hypothetical protein